MLLIIRAKRSRCENIESQVFRYFGTGAVLRVKNTTEENAEYIYELSRKILGKVQKQHPALTDDFYNLGQIESVNICLLYTSMSQGVILPDERNNKIE